MRYPTIDVGTGQDALEHHRAGERIPLEGHVVWAGEGADFSVDAAEWLSGELTTLRNSIDPDKLPRNEGGKFESSAAPIVHDQLSLDKVAGGDPGFWRWLTFWGANGDLLEFVDWRFGDSKMELVASENYGLENIWEGMFARLWVRGEIGFEPDAKDQYSIARRGDQDIWRSHVIRQEFARCNNLARALIRYQYPDKKPESRTLTNPEIRELAKQLKVRDACYAFELLDKKQLVDVIVKIVHEIQADRDSAAV
jgi:hypothetical protein